MRPADIHPSTLAVILVAVSVLTILDILAHWWYR